MIFLGGSGEKLIFVLKKKMFGKVVNIDFS